MPITIAVGVMSSSNIAAYADIDQFSKVETVINNIETARYIQEVNDENDIILNEKINFRNHLAAWQSETMFMSSVEDIVSQLDFKAILGMGKRAVPFILDEIEVRPSNLVWALNMIYERKITSKPDTTVTEACKLWIKALRPQKS